jgi:hypothetical protein
LPGPVSYEHRQAFQNLLDLLFVLLEGRLVGLLLCGVGVHAGSRQHLDAQTVVLPNAQLVTFTVAAHWQLDARKRAGKARNLPVP